MVGFEVFIVGDFPCDAVEFCKLAYKPVMLDIKPESPSSSITELSAAEGMVGKKRTPRRGGEVSSSSCTASWRTKRGLGRVEANWG